MQRKEIKKNVNGLDKKRILDLENTKEEKWLKIH